MDRTKGILAAGSLTGLVLLTILALGFRSPAGATGAQEAAIPAPAPLVIEKPATGTAADEALQAWRTYSGELENTVQTLQQREAQYQAQVEAANQTILQLQDQVNSANAATYQGTAPAYGDDDGYEDEEDDYEEHEEREEYEEHEAFEDDD